MSPTGRRARERAIEIGLAACAGLSLLVTAGIVAVLAAETVAFFRDVSPVAFLTGTTWTPLFFNQQFGVLPLVVGTVLVAAIALATAVPAGIVSALYLSEYAPPRVRRVAKPALEVLAGIPTVVYGYFALLFVTPWLQQWIPGLTAWSGVSAAVVLAMSRAIGETMIVAIAAGQQPRLTVSPLVPIETMTAYLVQVSLGDVPAGTTAYRTIFAVGSLLFAGTFVLNLCSDWLRRRVPGAAR